jgi:hypothetical protein
LLQTSHEISTSVSAAGDSTHTPLFHDIIENLSIKALIISRQSPIPEFSYNKFIYQ